MPPAANDNRPQRRPQWYDDKLIAHMPLAHKCAYRMASDDDHDEVLQDFYEAAIRKWDAFDADNFKFATWVYIVMRNVCQARRRARRSASRTGTTVEINDIAVIGASALTTPATQQGCAELSEVIRRLTGTRDSEAIVRVAMGETMSEVGQTMGITRQRVLQLIERERAALMAVATPKVA